MGVLTMTDEQREFWRALTAPFPRSAYKVRDGRSKQKFTYLDSRTIMNRLDDVVGPGHWDLEFRECTRGIICRLTISAPNHDGTIMKCWKEGGGSFRSMQDEDSTFKTGFSSAIKVAAATLGIGRDLYEMGMPAYCADLFDGNASGLPTSGAGSGPPPRDSSPNGQGNNGQGNGNYDKLKPPYGKPGKAPYAWSRNVSEHFQTDILGRMIGYAKKRNKPERTDQWDEGFLDECLAKTVEWIRTLENYNGEYGETPAAAREQPPASRPAPAPGQVHSLVAPISSAVNALIHGQTGRDATPVEAIAFVQHLAASVPNGNGQRGEVMKSLRACSDTAWLRNILNAANKQISDAAVQAESNTTPDDDIPF